MLPRRFPEGYLSVVLVGADSELLQALTNFLVLKWRGPASTTARLRGRVLGRHPQQGDADLVRQLIGRVTGLGKWPLGIGSRRMQKRQGGFGANPIVSQHTEVVETNLAFHLHSLKRVRANRSSVDIPIQHGVDNRIVGAAKLEVLEMMVRVDSLFFQFSPSHQPATERRLLHGHEGLPLEVAQLLDVFTVRSAKDHSGKHGVDPPESEVLQCCNRAGTVSLLQADVERRIGEGEIYLAPLDSREDLVEIKRHNFEAIPGNLVRQVLSRRVPLGQTSITTSLRQHPNPDQIRTLTGRGV